MLQMGERHVYKVLIRLHEPIKMCTFPSKWLARAISMYAAGGDGVGVGIGSDQS